MGDEEGREGGRKQIFSAEVRDFPATFAFMSSFFTRSGNFKCSTFAFLTQNALQYTQGDEQETALSSVYSVCLFAVMTADVLWHKLVVMAHKLGAPLFSRYF